MGQIEYTGRDNLDVMQLAVNYNACLLRLILRFAVKGDMVVDFGAGNGVFSCCVAGAGYQVTCIETDPVLSAVLADHGMTVCNDLGEIEDRSIDYIYSLNVIEHIADDTGVMALWYRKLRPGGKLMVYVPAGRFLYSSMDLKVGHVRRYSKKELLGKLSRAGFDVRESRYIDSLGVAAAFTYKLLDTKDGRINPVMLTWYDRWAFPISRMLDTITHPVCGKNVYAQAVKPDKRPGAQTL